MPTRLRDASGSLTDKTKTFAHGSSKIPGSVISISASGNYQDNQGHPAPFPVALPANLIAALTAETGICYEPFCGSGTSIIAAEQMGRTCYGVELAPEYCDIILARWRKVTGTEPIRTQTNQST